MQGLSRLGLTVMLLSRKELLLPPNMFAARTLRIGDGQIQFWDRLGASTTMASTGARLIIHGSVETREQRERTTTKMKLNLPATLLTGGIPIRRKTTEKTVETSVSSEAFVRIFRRTSSEPTVQIRQHEFDYSFLGSQMAPASLTNFSRLVTMIRTVLPQAAFDDRLTKTFAVDLPSTTPWEKVDIACNLIYLFGDSSTASGDPQG